MAIFNTNFFKRRNLEKTVITLCSNLLAVNNILGKDFSILQYNCRLFPSQSSKSINSFLYGLQINQSAAEACNCMAPSFFSFLYPLKKFVQSYRAMLGSNPGLLKLDYQASPWLMLNSKILKKFSNDAQTSVKLIQLPKP